MRFPDVAVMVREFLLPHLSPVTVHTDVPSTRPPVFVRVWRTGGAAVNRVVERPLITVQAWAASSVAASELAGDCRMLLLNGSPSMPLVRDIEEVTGPYADPDPASGAPRCTFTVQYSVRAKR